MLFQKEHVTPILQGRKTQTRRLWRRPMVKAGGTYWAQTKLFDSESRFARLKVTRRWKERLADISEADAKAEGYSGRVEYLRAFLAINHISGAWPFPDIFGQEIYCVEFELVQAGG